MTFWLASVTVTPVAARVVAVLGHTLARVGHSGQPTGGVVAEPGDVPGGVLDLVAPAVEVVARRGRVAQRVLLTHDPAQLVLHHLLGTLAGPELAGERLTVAYETKDQEHEHSCFSDNTRDDLVLAATGIRNLVVGRYERTGAGPVTGTGLRAVVAASQPELAGRLTEATEASLRALRAIPAPFDQAILGKDGTAGRQAIRRAIAAVQNQADRLAEVVRALRLPLTL